MYYVYYCTYRIDLIAIQTFTFLKPFIKCKPLLLLLTIQEKTQFDVMLNTKFNISNQPNIMSFKYRYLKKQSDMRPVLVDLLQSWRTVLASSVRVSFCQSGSVGLVWVCFLGQSGLVWISTGRTTIIMVCLCPPGLILIVSSHINFSLNLKKHNYIFQNSKIHQKGRSRIFKKSLKLLLTDLSIH